MSVDLCRGPHLRHTGQIGALKLLTVSSGVRVRVVLPLSQEKAREWRGWSFLSYPFSVLMADEEI
jgi:alanyl-tRNA synthetase